MAHVPRCLLPDLGAEELQLDTATRHHVERVLRLRTGDATILVDGRGGLAHARLVAAGRVRIELRAPIVPPDPRAVSLAVAVPRLPRLEWLVEKACELGVAELHLLETQHGERGLGAPRLARLFRLADEALLQCGRLHRMRVLAPAPVAAVLAALPATDSAASAPDLWLASPPNRATGEAGDASGAASRAASAPAPGTPHRRFGRALVALVGPEGGFTADEQEQVLARGAQRVCLGSTVLRVETAALAMAVLGAAAGDGPVSGAGGTGAGSLR